MAQHVQAIVVGGGPAGALAAAFLAQHGWSVALVERGPQNRHKACGHCLNARAVALLRELGVEHCIQSNVANHVRRIQVTARRSDTANWRIGDDGDDSQSVVISRSDFDQSLRDHAARCGAAIWHSTAATIHDVASSSIRVALANVHRQWEVTCDLLIGADGVGSGVARRAGLAHRSENVRHYGFSFDFSTQAQGPWSDNAIAMYVIDCGYLGMVRQSPTSWHIGALVRGNARCNPKEFLLQVAAAHPTLNRMGLNCFEPRTADGFCAAGPMPWPTHRPADRRVVLVGDAAGYVEPFTGEGMTWAIESAAILRDLLASTSPGRWSSKLSAAYCALWKQRIKRRQWFCHFVASALARPRLWRWMLNAVARHPQVAQRIIARTMAA